MITTMIRVMIMFTRTMSAPTHSSHSLSTFCQPNSLLVHSPSSACTTTQDNLDEDNDDLWREGGGLIEGKEEGRAAAKQSKTLSLCWSVLNICILHKVAFKCLVVALYESVAIS